ncbi:hypothetical protein ACHAXN_011550 [Cyclotella atomus]
MKLIWITVLVASSHAFTLINTSTQPTARRSTNLFYRNDVDVYQESAPKRPDFRQRMKSIVKQQQRTEWRPDNMKTATSLQEYANVIEEGRRNKCLVVVNFHATWCKKCHSLRPAFKKMAVTNPQTIYLDVPVSESNLKLQKGLGIETVPYCHIYHPEQGLVEETKISRETLSDFVSMVNEYC